MNYWTQLQYRWKHRGQPSIQRIEGTVRTSDRSRFFFERSYDHIEVVRRGVDMIIDSVTEIDVNITGTIAPSPVHKGGRIRQKTLLTLLKKHSTLEVRFEICSACLNITVWRDLGRRSKLGLIPLNLLDEGRDPERVIENMINTLVEGLYEL